MVQTYATLTLAYSDKNLYEIIGKKIQLLKENLQGHENNT